MREAVFVLAIAACRGGLTPPVAPPGNPASPSSIAAQQLGTLVVSELDKGCPHAHPIAITVDGTPVAAIDAGCKPKPLAHDGVIVTSSDSPTFRGPAFALSAGRHLIAARDAVTGSSATASVVAPVRGSSFAPKGTGPAADTVMVVVSDTTIRIGVVILANVLMM